VNFQKTVITIGGLDPSGGAGLFVDAAAIRFVGLHPAPVCAVITVQNGVTFSSSRSCSSVEVRASMRAVSATQRVVAIKTGALGNAAVVRAVAREVKANPDIPLIVDPVLKSTTSGSLFMGDASRVLVSDLLPLATLVTPNLDEAQYLTGITVTTPSEMIRAGKAIVAMGPFAVLVKGGHLPGERLVDVLVTRGGHVRHYEADRCRTGNVRGTGCALASLIAAHIGLGAAVEDAVQAASDSLRRLIAQAVHIGNGPMILAFQDPMPKEKPA